ncbi:MAG TPA: hypothetical protein ENI27_05340 [bacterium]|nr:hypothetical protein [bacterium]
MHPWRWKRNQNEVYGRSPGLDILSELKALQRQRMWILLNPLPAALTMGKKIKRLLKRLVKLEE